MDTLEGLASSIVEKLAVVSRLMSAQSSTAPSFAENGLAAYESETVALRKARHDLARAARSLWLLAQGPQDHILQLAWSATDAANLDVLLRFKFAESVPQNDTITTEELAAEVGLPMDVTARIIRYAIGNGLFMEPSAGVFVHSATSAALAGNDHLRNIAVISTETLTRSLVRTADALELQQKGGEDAPHAAFNLAYPDQTDCFAYAGSDKIFADKYHKYMVGRANTPRWAIGHLLQARDWSLTGPSTIVDVGGSAGHTSLALAEACPEAKFIVQDVDPVALEQGRMAIAATPHLASRLNFVQYNFFQSNTVTGDIYIFRHIFHDWSDADVVRILKNLVPALKDGAVVLVSEGIMPEPPASIANTLDEKQILMEDMFMLAVHAAKERSVSDFCRLFEQADARFQYVGTSGGVDGAFQSLVEFKFRKSD